VRGQTHVVLEVPLLMTGYTGHTYKPCNVPITLQVLNAAGCSLVGGHTCEGTELGVGFSVTGEVDEGRVMRKSGLKPGTYTICQDHRCTNHLLLSSSFSCAPECPELTETGTRFTSTETLG
jgi:hypothetical protein